MGSLWRLILPPWPGWKGILTSFGDYLWATTRWLIGIGLMLSAVSVLLPSTTKPAWDAILAAVEASLPTMGGTALVMLLGGGLAYHSVEADRQKKMALLAPRLVIETDRGPACAQNDVTREEFGGARRIDKWRRVRVSVSGERSVDNVRVVLADVRPGGAYGRALRERDDKPAPGAPFALAFRLNSGESRYFDVAFRSNSFDFPEDHFVWCYTDRAFPNQQPDGLYTITVLATGDGVPPTRADFRLVSGGNNWLSLDALNEEGELIVA